MQELARETLVLILEFSTDISCYSRITLVLPGAAVSMGDAGAPTIAYPGFSCFSRITLVLPGAAAGAVDADAPTRV